MGFLKGFLRKAEEEIADILPGGKTGKSIRAQRKAPVAKTVSRPRDESKSWLSKDFNPVSDGINDIKSAFKYASKDWKASEFQRQQDTQNANRQILKKYTQGQLNKNQVESLLGSKTKNAGLKKQGNLYVNTVKNGVGETLLQNTGAGIMNAAPQRVVGGLAEYGGTALGNDSIRDFGTRLNQPFRDYNALAYENAGNKTAAIGGNIAGNLLTLPIAPAGKAGLAYRGVVAGAPVAADTGYAIKQAGGGRVAQTVGGGATGIASGYLNSVGGDKLLKPVGAVTSKLVGKTVTTKLAPTAFGRIGAGVLNEGGEEVIEQGVDNAVAKSTYDPDRKLTDNLATSFLLGGAMGGVVRGGVELGNPTTRTQLINESKIKDIAGNQGGFIRISEDPIIDVESKLQKLNPNLDTNSLSDQQKRIALANIEQQQGRVNTDTGRKMFGSKKDLAKLRRINTENIQEIENQGERVAAKMVTKARVLGEDAKYTVNRSGDPAVENYKKLATSAIPSAPAQNAEARAWYVENVPKYIEKVKSANSIEEIEIAGRNLVNSANVEKTMMTYDNQERKYSSNDSRKWLGSRSYNMLRGYSGAMRTAKYRPPTDFSFDEKKASTKTGTDGTTKPQIHGGEQVPYERVGAQQLKNKDPKSMVKDFGFKGLEYGNYVKDTEASNHMTRFGDSMMDLETALDIDFTALNKQMDVGVGFGSRGTGKALAHYEPSNKVINITKKNTVDGSLAHEYMHGIDDFLSESKTGGKYASNGRAVKPATKEAMDTLMRAIREGDGSYKKTIQSDGTDRSSRQWSQVDSFIEEANGNGQLAMDNLQKRYPGSSSKSMNSVAQHIMSKTNMTSIKIPTGRSEFYDLAKEQGAYWERPTEMLARAFDGYIGNKLDQAGIKNNYVAKGSRQPGLMHPSEAHAQQLEPLFDNLFKAIKSDYNLPSPTQRATAETAETTKSADPTAPQVGKTLSIDKIKPEYYLPGNEPSTIGAVYKVMRNEKVLSEYQPVVDVYKKKIQNGETIEPIIINDKNVIVDGQHRFDAYKQLGINDIPVRRGHNFDVFAPQPPKTVAPVESKPTVTKKPTLQDALDGKSTKIAPKKTVSEPKIAPVEPKQTEPAQKKPFIPDEVKTIRAKREANTSQQNQSDQKRKNQQALRSKSSLQSQPESKVAPRTGVQPISEAVQGRVNKSPQKARQGIGSIGKQKSLSGLSSKDTIQLSGVNVNDPFNNRKIGKRLKNEFGRYFVDEDAEMINLMKRIEKETGQKDLVETWLQDSDLVRNTNSIANSKIRRNENLKLALRGLSKQQQRSFDEYASARTELSNLERGLESSSKPRQELERIVRDGNVDFGNRFIALNNYYGDWAKDLHDAGIISKSKLDEWSKNKDYVRVQRDMEDILNYTPPTGKSRSFGTTSTSKKRTGSKREILSPTNIALERGQQLQLEIQRNKAASNTIDTLEKYGLAEKVSQQHATGKNVIKRFKDGKVEYFATSKDVKRVIENVNPFQLGVLGRVISTPTRLFRSGTTALSAPFATTNYARDQVSSAIYSKDVLATHNPKNIVSGIASATKDYFGESSNPLWAKFEQVAGDQTQFDEMRNTSSSRATMRELRQGGKGELINKIVNPVRSMEDLIGITEKATRFQNFKGTYEAEMKRSGNEKIATQKASQAALQNSVNFTRAGKAMRVINLLLPYSNAGIQGSRNVARSFRSRPVATTMKSVAFVAVPTVLLTLMNYDDEETAKVYKNIDDTEKDDNFIIVLKGAKQNEAGSYEGIIKIPKPQGYRELTNPLRIAAERFAGNEKPGDVSKMVRDAMSAFTGPVSIEDSGKFISSLIPQAVKPTLQAMENKDYYWDSQTVPDYMIDGTDDPTKRAYKSTSGTARIIANQLGVSPILVEKFIQDTTGSVGRYGINLTDRGLNKLGIVKDEQIGGRTITGDFKRRTTEARAIEKTNKTSGQRYYDNVEKATGDLPKYLQDSWKSYNTSNKNFLGEELFTKNGQAKKQAKAAAYIEHPELFDVDKKLDKLNRKKGETGNPLYDLSYNQALIVVQEKALPPGAKDEGLNALYDQQWYSQYKNKEEKYYDKIFGKGGIEENKDNPYPERSPDLISAMDYYYDLPSSYDKGAWKKANPDIASQMDAYYSAKDAWTNTERAKIGLPPIEDRFAKYGKSSGKSSSSGGRGGSRSGGRSSSGGSRKGKFDYKFGAFAPGEVGSKKSLRKILEEAQL